MEKVISFYVYHIKLILIRVKYMSRQRNENALSLEGKKKSKLSSYKFRELLVARIFVRFRFED